MSASRVAELSAAYALQTAMEPALVASFDLLATAPQGVAKLRELILSLAVRGKLVTQDPEDEFAEELLARARQHSASRMEAGCAKREKPAPPVKSQEKRFALPAQWTWCRIVDTGEYINGMAFKPSDWGNSGRPIIRIQNLSGRAQDFNRTTKEVDASVIVKSGDILVSWSATLDAFVWSGEEGVLNQHIFRVTPSLLVDRNFLYWLLKGVIKELAASDHAHGLVMSHINRGPFLAYPVAIPPLAEQARIVARVEELMQLCDALEAHDRLQDEQHARLVATLFDALAASESAEALAENWQRLAAHFDLLLDRPETIDVFEQTILRLATHGLLVGNGAPESMPNFARERSPGVAPMFDVPAHWAWGKLESVLESGPSNGFSPKPSENGEGVRCLTLSATTKGYFRAECYKFIDISAQTAQRYYLKKGDLLIQRANSLEYVGIAAIYDGNDDEYTFPDLMMRMRVSPSSILKEYLHVWLVSADARWYMRSKATGTQGNMPKVNQGVVREMPVPLPPLTEQHRIVARVEQLRRLCADLRESLQQARATQSRLADALVSTAAQSPAC